MSGNRALATVVGALAWQLLWAAPAAADAVLPQPGFAAGGQARERPAQPRFASGEAIVGLQREAGAAARRRALRGAGAQVERRLAVPGARLLRLPPGEGVREAIRGLRGLPGVAYAQPNWIRRAAAAPDDPLFGSQWGLENSGQAVAGFTGTADADIDAAGAWDVQTGSPQVTVAIVDTGVDLDHPDLAPNLWRNPGEVAGNGVDDDGNGFTDDARGWDFVDSDADPRDLLGHGTHVAGIAGAAGGNATGVSGVAQDVSLMPVRVLNAQGAGTDADIADGFSYAAANGARVVNASLAGPGQSPVLESAVSSAPGTLFVVAAGNEGADNDAEPQLPCNIAAANLICVAASDSGDRLASFSNFGASSVDLAAPGTAILSTMIANGGDELLYDDFETPIAGRWTTGGTPNTWERTTEAFASSAFSLTDSPGADYQPGTDSFARSPALSTATEHDCQLDYEVLLDTLDPLGDSLIVEASANGTSWTTVGTWTVPGSFHGTNDLSAFDGSSTLFVRFRLVADADLLAGDGAYVDDVQVSCLVQQGGYAHLSGTSMATPHVAGAAALLVSESLGAPSADASAASASPASLVVALLGSVDRTAGLSGKVASGGRLNAQRALPAIAPPDTDPPNGRIRRHPPKRTEERTARFGFRSDEQESSFKCKLDGRKFRPCESPKSYEVGPGRHRFRVRTIDPAGNRDPKPARWRWRVVRN